MNAAARDTRLPLQARAIAFWILDNPTEGIDPDIIAKANDLAVSYVRKLLGKLAEFGHLIAPKKYRAEKGRIAYTPYELPPQDKITVTVEEPSRSETPHGQNNQHGQQTVTVEIAVGESSTTEYVHEDERAAGDKDGLLSLNTKNSLVLSETNNQTDSLKPENTRDQGIAPVVDDGVGKAAEAYEKKIGLLNPMIKVDIIQTVDDFGSYPVVMAIHKAAEEVAKALRGEREPIRKGAWSYAKGILDKQKSEGNLPIEPVALPEPEQVDDVFSSAPPLTPSPSVAAVEDRGSKAWRDLLILVDVQQPLFVHALRAARYGGIDDDNLVRVYARNEKSRFHCDDTINRNRWLDGLAQSIFGHEVQFEFAVDVLERIPDAHPATG